MAMKLVDRKPILFTQGTVDITYVCESCQTPTIRTNEQNRLMHQVDLFQMRSAQQVPDLRLPPPIATKSAASSG